MVQFAKHSPHWFLGWALAGSWSWGWWGERKWPPLPQGYSQSQLPVEMTSPHPHPACPQRRAQVRFCTGSLTLRSQQEGDMPYPHTGETRSCSTWSPGGGFHMGVPVPQADAEVSGPTPCSPPDPDACLRSAQHHLPGSWVLPASCPSLTQTTPHRVATSVFLNLGQILSLSTFNCHQRLLTQQEQSPHLPGFLLLLSLPVAHPDLVLGAPNVDVNFVHASFSWGTPRCRVSYLDWTPAPKQILLFEQDFLPLPTRPPHSLHPLKLTNWEMHHVWSSLWSRCCLNR